jgi:ankyrin repeat protein
MSLDLIDACGNNDFNHVKLLLDYGADVHYENDYALELAVDRNNLKIVKLLLSYGADPSANNFAVISVAKALNFTNILDCLNNKLISNKLKQL